MFYNGRYFLQFLLFVMFLYATLDGLMIIKVKSYEGLLSRWNRVEGTPAVLAGGTLVALGFASLVALVALFI
jgi:hypothetical protein